MLQNLRNIGIIAHIDAGKTTTTERILYYTGLTHKIGETHDGESVMDYLPYEKERGITVNSAATRCMWKNCSINIIDTPGHVDFTAEVERSLRILDGAVVIFCARGGVEPQSETVWHQADKYNVPRIAYINKMDSTGADYFAVIKQIESRLNSNPLVITLPMWDNEEFTGIIDLISMQSCLFEGKLGNDMVTGPIPAEYEAEAAQWHDRMLEKLADVDDELMEKYLSGESITLQQVKTAIRTGTIAGRFVPVMCGSSYRNIGVQVLLDCIVDFLPSPLDVDPPSAEDADTGEKIEIHPDAKDKFCALVFKITSDRHVGKLAFARIYSGTAESGSYIYNSTRQKKERISRLLRIHANHREDINQAEAGDIVALVGLKNVGTGDTICSLNSEILLESIKFPEPVMQIAVEPKTQADQDKITEALERISSEDPTFKISYDKETGQTLIAGMGELHLEIISERLEKEFNVDINVGQPQVAYKETIGKAAENTTRFVKQTGGKGQYAHVVIKLEPAEEFEFISAITGGVVPREYIPAVEQGVKQALQEGPLKGYPVVNVKATLLDGSYHEVDSSELAFKTAASICTKECLTKAHPQLLEPIMKLEITAPEEFTGAIINNISNRRGRLESMETVHNRQVIKSFIPLAELFGYSTVLRSLTQGRAGFSMEFSHYQERRLES